MTGNRIFFAAFVSLMTLTQARLCVSPERELLGPVTGPRGRASPSASKASCSRGCSISSPIAHSGHDTLALKRFPQSLSRRPSCTECGLMTAVAGKGPLGVSA